MSTTFKTTIDSSIEPKLNEWFAAQRGVKMWVNQEIGSGATREVFTPGDAEKPGWRYGNPVDLQPDDIEVEEFSPVESFRGRFKAMYWGPWVAKATEEKAKRLVEKHGSSRSFHSGNGYSWRWEHDDLPGYVQVTIGRMVKRAFCGVLSGAPV
jgi:hypothetical protein